MMRSSNIYKMAVSALLCAIGIVIPLISPFKIVMEPASFTLGSHVAIFIAMFISPPVAIAVALGTTAGFFLGGFPIVIVLRAATHVIFAFAGAMILKKNFAMISSLWKSQVFSFFIGLLHAACEVAVVTVIYFGEGMSTAYYDKGYVTSVLLLVGIGTVVHSMVDCAIALGIWKVISKDKNVMGLRA